MRWYHAAILLLLLPILCACSGQKPPEAQSAAPSQSETAAQPSAPQETTPDAVAQIEADAGVPAPVDPSWDTLEGEKTADGIALSGAYYTLTLPVSWDGRYIAEESGNWLYLYSRDNYEAGFGGLLLSILWTSDPAEYNYLPDYRKLGTVTMEGFTYDVVAELPQEPQAGDGTLLETYTDLQGDIPDILASLEFGEAGVFTPEH